MVGTSPTIVASNLVLVLLDMSTLISQPSSQCLEKIRKYYTREVYKRLVDREEMTESQRRHMESSNTLIGCILQTMAHNEKKENVRRRKSNQS